MTNEKLAERAVKAKGWRWMPGMQPLALDNDRDWIPCERVWRTQGGKLVLPQGAIPDLDDPATLGCLLALVREVYDSAVVITQGNGWWRVETDHYVWHQDDTAPFQEALVAALEAAPCGGRTMIEVAKKAVACKHWRWMVGMRCTHRWMSGIRVLADENGEQSESYVVLPDADGNAVMTLHDCGIMGGFPNADSAYPFLPDLTDPATLGCVLAILREVRGMCSCFETVVGWRVYSAGGTVWSQGKSEGEALIKALEAAP